MVFYIAYKASREYKNRGMISRKLKALGCKRICSSFWEVNGHKIDEVLRAVGENQPILLKRTREIRRPEYNNEGNIVDLGSLIVLTYNAERDENGRVKGLLARTPYIRLCRSVYAFCQNSRQYDKRGEVSNVSQILALLREGEGEAKIFSRMIIMNNSVETIHILLERVRARITRRTERILEGYKILAHSLLNGHTDRKHIIEEEKKLYSEFIALRKMAIFYEKWLRIDLAGSLMKVYSVIRKLQSLKMRTA